MKTGFLSLLFLLGVAPAFASAAKAKRVAFEGERGEVTL